MTAQEAKAYLQQNGIDFTKDFYETVGITNATMMVETAQKVGYRKPANAPGSLARCFFYYLQRKA